VTSGSMKAASREPGPGRQGTQNGTRYPKASFLNPEREACPTKGVSMGGCDKGEKHQGQSKRWWKREKPEKKTGQERKNPAGGPICTVVKKRYCPREGVKDREGGMGRKKLIERENGEPGRPKKNKRETHGHEPVSGKEALGPAAGFKVGGKGDTFQKPEGCGCRWEGRGSEGKWIPISTEGCGEKITI